ncbi:MAG: glycosyltransferase [Flavobacteriales bacterium]|nr:glycosyltransferase [Flavobacteriales bacterium]
MTDQHFAIIAPCYNEGSVAVRFVEELEQVLARQPHRFTVVMVDDASPDDTLHLLLAHTSSAPNVKLRCLSLGYNMGHQEAIYQGLQFASTLDAGRFIVMDSDGEDDPGAIVELAGISEASIAFVARGRRSEPVGFRIGYQVYRLVFRLLAGRSIPFGNYCMIDRRVLSAVLDRSFTHYAAFLSRQRVATRVIVRDRRPRIDGTSKMSFRGLSVHAFRALIEYSEEVLSTFLRGLIGLAIVLLLSLMAIVGIKLFTPWAIPGWASLLSVSLFNGMLLCLGFFTTGLLLVNTAQRRERAGRHLYTVHPDGSA